MKNICTIAALLLLASSAARVPQTAADAKLAPNDGPAYGGAGGTHYSALQQINVHNVQDLAVAWTYDTKESGGLETSPIIVDGVLFGITPAQRIFALDAATGKELWKFGPGVEGGQPNRGLSYWAEGNDRRILAGIENFLYALDAGTGQAIA